MQLALAPQKKFFFSTLALAILLPLAAEAATTSGIDTAAGKTSLDFAVQGNQVGTWTPNGLAVSGSVSTGYVTLGTACAPEGSLAYDIAAHEPVFCSQSLVWTNAIRKPGYTVSSYDLGFGGWPPPAPTFIGNHILCAFSGAGGDPWGGNVSLSTTNPNADGNSQHPWYVQSICYDSCSSWNPHTRILCYD